jgi:hypothetical protein
MIRINLLKQPVKKKVARKPISPRLLMVSGITTGVLIITVGGWWMVTYFDLLSPKEARTKELARDDISPSTFVSSHTVEDVVSDIDDSPDILKRRGILDMPYEQLSSMEKINYEIHYAKNICDMLTRSAIPGVDFNSISLQSFSQFRGIGRSPSKESVVQLFVALKKEKIDLLPKPKTRISRGDEGYQFSIMGTTHFGLNLEAPFLLGPDDIIAYSDIGDVLLKIKDSAENDRVRLENGLTRENADIDGAYRRLRYRFTAFASYSDFVSFITNLYNRQVPCAFEDLKIVAQSNSRIKIDASIKITTKL